MEWEDFFSGLTDLRRELHRRPELSGEERETAARLRAILEECGPAELLTGLGGEGLAAVFTGPEKGPTVVFRAETDALPIPEEELFPHASLREGISHKCGHDGHMAILIGVARYLKDRPLRRGRLVLLFQPAEETGNGARAVAEDSRFTGLDPDYLFALHNWPGFPRGSVVLREGTMFSPSAGIALELTGQSAHAMSPEEGRSPVEAIKRIHTGLKELYNPDRESEDFCLVTTCGIRLGDGDFGVAPGRGYLYLTARAYGQDVLDRLLERLSALAAAVAAEEDLTLRLTCHDVFPGVTNTPQGVELVRRASERTGLTTVTPTRGMGSSEDFGHLLKLARRGGALFLLGSGEDSPPLHSYHFDFDDRLIPPGVEIFLALADDILGREDGND